jgi:hypothetical protein
MLARPSMGVNLHSLPGSWPRHRDTGVDHAREVPIGRGWVRAASHRSCQEPTTSTPRDHPLPVYEAFRSPKPVMSCLATHADGGRNVWRLAARSG